MLEISMSKSQSRHQQQFAIVMTAFVGLGIQIGIWSVLIADLTSMLQITPGALGAALTCMYIAGMITVMIGGRLADRLGRRPLLVAAMLGLGLFVCALGAVPSYHLFVVAVIFGGVWQSLYNLMNNTIGSDYEHQNGSRVMSVLYAGVSASAALGALLCGALLKYEVDYRLIFFANGLLLLTMGCAFLRLPLPAHSSEQTTERAVSKPVLTLLIIPGVLFSMLFVFFSFFVDASLIGYAALYLRNLLGSDRFISAVGIAVLNLAAMTGRLLGNAAVMFLGERRLLLIAGAGSTVGMLLLVSTSQVVPALIGFLLVGIALAPVAPVAFSLATRAAPEARAQAASILAGFGSVAYFVSPLVIGGLANIFALQGAFVGLLVIVLVITVLACVLPATAAPDRRAS